jgi:predicted RNA-binding protein YlqC (UPF0109 family)
VTDIEEGADDDRELENAADDEAEDAGDANRIPAATARDVCEYVVKQIVEEPDGVEVDVNDRGRVTAIEVRVAQGDMGRVIGKRGRIAQSIRTVVRAAAVRDGATVDVEFLE